MALYVSRTDQPVPENLSGSNQRKSVSNGMLVRGTLEDMPEPVRAALPCMMFEVNLHIAANRGADPYILFHRPALYPCETASTSSKFGINAQSSVVFDPANLVRSHRHDQWGAYRDAGYLGVL